MCISAGEKERFHIHSGIAHLRQLVAQGAWADAQALGRFFTTAAFGAQGVDDHLEFAAAQVVAQGTGRLGRRGFDLWRGRRKEAAERLGISPRTLRYKLAQMRDAGMDVEAYLYAT